MKQTGGSKKFFLKYLSKKKKVVVLFLVLFGIGFIGTGYVLRQLAFVQTGINTLTSGCFKLEYTSDTDAINLNDAYPMSDKLICSNR